MPGPDRRNITLSDPLAFFLLNVLLHLPFIGLNRAEFTDGILQLNVLHYKIGLYPPLFGALANLLALLPGVSAEIGGRIVSTLAASALVFPVWGMTRMMTGGNNRAARFALIFLTCSPLIARWSLHAMSDALFLFLATCCVWLASRAVCRACDDARCADLNLAGAVCCAVAATLTRYQGALLLLPGVLALIFVMRSARGVWPWRSFVASLLWFAVPAWMAYNGFGHSSQFSERATGQCLSTLFVYINCAENFVLTLPYHFTYPVTVLALVGLFKCKWNAEPAIPKLWWLWGLWSVGILVLQSAFQSFQYRYLMPILPLFLIAAGAGTAWLFERFNRTVMLWVVALSCALMTCMSLATVFGQYQSFGDQRLAMRWVKENTAPSTPVFGNERYGRYVELGCLKWDVWSGRTISPYWMPEDGARMPSGSIVVLSDAYGGPQMSAALSNALTQQGFTIEPLTMFSSTILPVFDDVMPNPQFNQNPIGWLMRYTPQELNTRILRVTKGSPTP